MQATVWIRQDLEWKPTTDVAAIAAADPADMVFADDAGNARAEIDRLLGVPPPFTALAPHGSRFSQRAFAVYPGDRNMSLQHAEDPSAFMAAVQSSQVPLRLDATDVSLFLWKRHGGDGTQWDHCVDNWERVALCPGLMATRVAEHEPGYRGDYVFRLSAEDTTEVERKMLRYAARAARAAEKRKRNAGNNREDRLRRWQEIARNMSLTLRYRLEHVHPDIRHECTTYSDARHFLTEALRCMSVMLRRARMCGLFRATWRELKPATDALRRADWAPAERRYLIDAMLNFARAAGRPADKLFHPGLVRAVEKATGETIATARKETSH